MSDMTDCPMHPGLRIEEVIVLDARAIIDGAGLLR